MRVAIVDVGANTLRLLVAVPDGRQVLPVHQETGAARPRRGGRALRLHQRAEVRRGRRGRARADAPGAAARLRADRDPRHLARPPERQQRRVRRRARARHRRAGADPELGGGGDAGVGRRGLRRSSDPPAERGRLRYRRRLGAAGRRHARDRPGLGALGRSRLAAPHDPAARRAPTRPRRRRSRRRAWRRPTRSSAVVPPVAQIGLAAGGTARALRRVVGTLDADGLAEAVAELSKLKRAKIAKRYGVAPPACGHAARRRDPLRRGAAAARPAARARRRRRARRLGARALPRQSAAAYA